MTLRKAKLEDKGKVLETLDNFRSDCILQITRQPSESNTARTGGYEMYDLLLERADYIIFLLENESSEIVGIITGYLCPMLRSGQLRGEVEEFFVKKANSEGKVMLKN